MAGKTAAKSKPKSRKSVPSVEVEVPPHPVASAPAVPKGQPSIHYTVSIREPWTHYLEVEISLSNLSGKELLLRLPSWTPGSYKIRDFAKNVSHFAAFDPKGKPLAHLQSAKDTWHIDTKGTAALVVTYRVYSFELSVRTPHVDDTHAFFLPTNALMYIEGGLALPSLLTVKPWLDWQVYCPLPRLNGAGDHTFVSHNYDVLGDSPVECGDHQTAEFTVLGKRHEIVIHGWGNHDIELMTKDFPRIVAEAAKLFGGALPYDNYMFILHLLPGQRGGLEHLNSQVSAWDSLNFDSRDSYEDFLSLISHEFFHCWNVKRIRPRILGPFDYTTEQYAEDLWVMEGITTYYEWLVLSRAGLVTRSRLLKAMSAELTRWQDRPGNAAMSLADSGRLAWTKLYLADENFVNSGVSYYLKGGLVALCLDMEIRKLTKNEKSLDDVMRRLFKEYGLPKPGFAHGGFEAAVEKVVGKSLAAFWKHHLHSTEPLHVEGALDIAGLEVLREPQKRTGADGVEKQLSELPWFGWDIKDSAGKIAVTAVREGSPASDAGLSAKDEVIAIDSVRVSNVADVDKLLKMLSPGDTVEVAAFRDRFLREFVVQLAAHAASDPKIVERQHKRPAQTAVLDSWSGQP